MPFSPLEEGFLVGKIDECMAFDKTDFCNIFPHFWEKNRKANQGLAHVLCQLASQRNATTAQSVILSSD